MCVILIMLVDVNFWVCNFYLSSIFAACSLFINLFVTFI